MRKLAAFLAAVAAALFLAACGQGTTVWAGIGSGGTGGVASGSITGFGSVIVNGVRFDDTAARVTIEGAADRPVSDLRLGMVVEVRGAIDAAARTGRADEIVTALAARGPLAQVDAADATLSLLGQRVRVARGTVFDGFASLAALAPGDVVAVSGLVDPATGAIAATRIERRPASDAATVEVQGIVSALAASSFRLGALTVDDSAAQLVGMPAGGLANGMLVAVSGRTTDGGATLAATSVRATGTAPASGAFVEYMGYVSGFVSAASFDVGSLHVNAAGAQFSGGTSADLANGVRLEIEGDVVDGVVQAREVDFLATNADGATELEGTITDFLSSANFRVRGEPVDASHATFTGGGAADLASGRRVHVTGTVDGEVVAASSVRFLDAAPPEQERLAVDGNITDFASPASFRVNGQAVATTLSTVFSGGTASDLANGRHVAVQGVVSGGVLNAGLVTIFAPAPAPVVTTEGRISSFVSPASFVVNGQPVAAGGTTTYSGGDASQLANGVEVSVTGTIVNGVLQASAIQIHLESDSTEPAEVEGYISQFASVSSFKVADQLVNASAATFENGGPSDLANGLKVQAKGPIRNGVLMATTIEIDR